MQVLDSALVSLRPGIVCRDDGLMDTETAGIYEMNEMGCFVLDQIDGSASIADLVGETAQHFAVDPGVARADLLDFVAELHTNRLISVRQSFAAEFILRCRLLVWNMLGLLMFRQPYVRPRYPDRRYQATPARIVCACLEAYQLTLYLGVALALAAGILNGIRNSNLGVPFLTTDSITMAVVMIGYFYCLIGSAVVHELAHYWVATGLGVGVSGVFARLGVAGVTHNDDSPGKSALIAMAGPVAGIAVVGVCAGAAIAWPLPIANGPTIQTAIVYSCSGIALLHLRSLTPVSGEGRRLLGSLRRRYRPTIANRPWTEP